MILCQKCQNTHFFGNVHILLCPYPRYQIPICKYFNVEPGCHSVTYTSERVFELVVISNLIKAFQLLVIEVDIVCICKQGSLFRVEIRPIYLQHYISLLCLAEKQTHIQRKTKYVKFIMKNRSKQTVLSTPGFIPPRCILL